MSADDPRHLWADVRVILRNEEGRVGQELIALTGFSIRRAMDTVEGSLDPQARRRVTNEIITPLELARASIQQAMLRRGGDERLVLPGDVADLCRSQHRALCMALEDPLFPVAELPEPLDDPIAACRRFHRAAGLRLPRELDGSELETTLDPAN